MFFYYLLAAHFIGDFVLQTDTIALKKSKEVKWVFVHSLIVTLVMLITAIPAGCTSMATVLVAGIAHFFIDLLKMKIVLKSNISNFFYFIIDQFVHIIIIWIVARSYHGSSYDNINIELVYALDSFLFVIYFASVCIQFMLRIVFVNNDFYTHSEKALGNINRIVIYTIMLFAWFSNLAYALLIPFWYMITVAYYRKRLRVWMPMDCFVMKLILDSVFSAAGIFILIFLKVEVLWRW